MRHTIIRRIVLGLCAATAIAGLAFLSALVQHGENAPARPVMQNGPYLAGTPQSGGGRSVSLHAARVAIRLDAAEKMFLGRRSWDFGTVPRGTRLSHSFEMTNIYSVPISVTYLQPSCGCMSATTPRGILQPGEHSTINVGVDSSRFAGSADLNVRVKVNGPNWDSTCKLRMCVVSHASTQPDIFLAPVPVQANCRPAFSVAPALLRLGSARVGETVTRRILLQADKPFHVTGVDAVGSSLAVEFDAVATPARIQIVTVRLEPRTAGELKATLKIRTDLRKPPFTVTVIR
jgi:hypothetical protein